MSNNPDRRRARSILARRTLFRTFGVSTGILLIFLALIDPASSQVGSTPAPQASPPARLAAPQPDQTSPLGTATPTDVGVPLPPATAGAAATSDAATPNANATPPSAVPVGAAAKCSSRIASFGAEVVEHALNADIVVQVVMLGLILAALITWTVWLKKVLELRSARKDVRRALGLLDNARSFSGAHGEVGKGASPVARFMQAAAQEILRSEDVRSDGLKERIALRLERLEIAASRKVARGTEVLATIGSTAPFVGLFGTVWGIMNSFIGIENAHTTNLAVVAPGIAQALLATALGLMAAIPAVMTYNALARSTANYRTLLGDAAAEVMRLVSRDLDHARLSLARAAE